VILDNLASSKWTYDAGTAATVTVPSGVVVTHIMCYATGGAATLTITPGGAGQQASAGSAIPIPNGAQWFTLPMLGQLGAGTSLVFSGTASYFVSYAKVY
jgi:hypothetical protein